MQITGLTKFLLVALMATAHAAPVCDLILFFHRPRLIHGRPLSLMHLWLQDITEELAEMPAVEKVLEMPLVVPVALPASSVEIETTITITTRDISKLFQFSLAAGIFSLPFKASSSLRYSYTNPIIAEALEQELVEREPVEMLRLGPVDWLVCLEEIATMLPIIIRHYFSIGTYLGHHG